MQFYFILTKKIFVCVCVCTCNNKLFTLNFIIINKYNVAIIFILLKYKNKREK